eukprot:CAMPEP_0179312810 /NCGR_PEP_ID=MMETSP0797-20121207/53473_1 /TAXON_ID=47934 /ORGANISM="Dinophysis acuminata, Strain DAEP01" /LENGTH=339 /DNA_ID=CAMNT_0021022785 /DNA_START=33 /DNA_END=1048 /DNA_ORIENTATION=-
MTAVKAGLTLNLTSYFFYSGAIYAAAGVVGLVSYGPIEEFLCSIPSQTQGCSFCADNLLMCPKDACWRYAVNLTYIKVMDTPGFQFYKNELHKAASDTNCNDLVQVSTSPVDMLVNAREMRYQTSGAGPSDACLIFHCEVLRHAVMASVDTHLTSIAGPCINTLRVKPDSEATDCTCNSLAISMNQAQTIRTMCGAQTEGLRGEVFERILQRKDPCYQQSIEDVRNDIAYRFMYEIMVRQEQCVFLVQSSESVHGCTTVMCYAFDRTLRDGETCNWANNSNLGELDKALVDSIVDLCANTALPSRDFDPEYLCRVSSKRPQCRDVNISGGKLQSRRCAA